MSGDVSSDSFHLHKNGKSGLRFLTDTLRNELKKPQGLLIEGPFKDTMKNLKKIINKEKPSTIISVGDIVSKQMIKHGLFPNVLIVDNKTMRKPIPPVVVETDQTFYAINPPGTITKEAWDVIKQAMEHVGRTKVIIEGEEDLLTLVTVISAPEHSIVIYGQPEKGIVVVKVNKETREKMRRIVDRMIESSKS